MKGKLLITSAVHKLGKEKEEEINNSDKHKKKNEIPNRKPTEEKKDSATTRQPHSQF